MFKPEHKEQAFPRGEMDMPGMTLLDHFAGLAMQGLLSSNAHQQYAQGNAFNFPVLPRLSYEIAAAMMEQRQKYLTSQNSDNNAK